MTKTRLPKGWEKLWSNNKNRHYYINKTLGQKQWEKPNEQRKKDKIIKNTASIYSPLSDGLLSLPDKTIIDLLKEHIYTDPVNTWNSIEACFNSNEYRLVTIAMRAAGGLSTFGLMSTHRWLDMLDNMGYNYYNDTFSPNLRDERWYILDKDIIEFQMDYVNELRYTSRVHDLLNIRDKSRNTEYVYIARALIKKLVDNLPPGPSLERDFLTGNIQVREFDNNIIHSEIANIEDANMREIAFWDVRNVTDMSYLFANRIDFFREDVNLKYWDVRNVEHMEFMFHGVKNASNSIVSGLENWETVRVMYMSHMFSNTDTGISDISRWSTSKVTHMSCMFQYAISFNQPIGRWNTSRVTDMSGMFVFNNSFNQPIGFWDTSSVRDMSNMFSEAKLFDKDLSLWDTSKVENMSRMFADASSFNGDISLWKINNVRDMSSMFASATSFNCDISNWKPDNVMYMHCMFEGATSFNQPIGKWSTSTSNVVDMSGMFCEANIFNYTLDTWDTGNVLNMSLMFQRADAFNSPIGEWNTSNVRDMSEMFRGALCFNQPIGGWDTGNVSDMTQMFKDTISFDQPIGGWDTSNVRNMSEMFSTTSSFNRPIGGWNTTNVLDMKSMFESAKRFNQPIGNWDIGNVTDMSYMFAYTIMFDQDLSGWAQNMTQNRLGLISVETMEGMFMYTKSFNGRIESWPTISLENTSRMFENSESFNQRVDLIMQNVNNVSQMFAGAIAFDRSINTWNVNPGINKDNIFNRILHRRRYRDLPINWVPPGVDPNAFIPEDED